MACFIATDLEGTLSAGEAWRGIGAYLKTHGRARAHQMFFVAHIVPALLARVGILDKQAFRNQWLVDQAKLLRGFSASELYALGAWVVENELWTQRRGAVLAELALHHAAGCTLVIASAAYEPIANAFARKLNLERVRVLATPLEMVNGRASGNLGEIGVDARKAERVRALVGEGELVSAYGDTAPDAPMLALSREPVAVAPDAALEKIANEKQWRILRAD
jgi:phosphoserine phosphatase